MELFWVGKASTHFVVDDAEQSSLRYPAIRQCLAPYWDEQCNAWLCFLIPSEARKKKNLYCSQVWQCSIIKTILIEISLPRITEDPWTDFPTHAAHTSGLYHTVWWLFLSFEPHQLHKSHRKAPSSVLHWCHLLNLPSPEEKAAKLMERSDKTDTRCLLCPGQPGQADGITIPRALTAGGSISMWD